MLAAKFVKPFISDVKLTCFSLALFIYALWGSPTPDRPAFIEMTIAVFLLLAVGVMAPLNGLRLCYKAEKPLWHIGGWLLWVLGLSVPLVVGILQGADNISIFRDIAGFFFLCLPLFFFGFFENNRNRQNALIMMCCFVGFVFSLRTLYSAFPVFNQTAELLYLANSPLVLFSALFIFFYGCYRLFQKLTVRNSLIFLGCLSLAGIFFLAMFADTLRASFAAFGVSAIILAIIGLIKAPLRIFPVLLVSGLIALLFHDFVGAVIQDIMLKTSQVGLNMRLQEWYAVWDSLSGSWISVLFGQGWGSSFASPAVGGLSVTFTHSLLSYMLLKTGLIGLILCLIYLFFIFEKLAVVYFSVPVKGNALLWPFLIPVWLYASHKSFDFGLLLVLILVMAQQVSGKNKEKETF